MKRRKKLFVVAGVLSVLAAAFAILYLAFPRVLLRAAVAWQRSDAGLQCRWIEVQDWCLPYLDSQPGGKQNQETILLVHGFGDTKDRFIDLAKGLRRDGYRVLALDLPGFGETAIRMNQQCSSDFYVRCLVEFLEKLDIDSVHLVGYSMGGMLAAKVAARSPDRIRTLTLLAPAGLQGDQLSVVERSAAAGTEVPLTYRDRESFDRLLQLNFNERPEIPDFAMRAIVAEGRERADLHELIFGKLFDPADAAALEEEIKTLRMPTLLIWGTDDRILDVSAAERWSRANPNIRVVRIPNAGHALILQHLEKIHSELRSHLRSDFG